MSDESTLFTIQWGDVLRHLAQQSGSLLESTVTIKSGVVGERTTMEQVGPKKLKKRSSRHAVTPTSDPDLRRRWITMFDYDDATLFDSQDAMKMLLDPQNAFNMSLIMGANRVKDEVIIDAAVATAYIGKDGTSTQAITNTIANGGLGLTLDKIRQAARTFQQGYVDPTERRVLVIGPKDHEDLLKLTEVISRDYAEKPVLVDGVVKRLMGFDIIISQILADRLTASSVTQCLAYTTTGMGLALAVEPELSVDKRPDLSNSMQAYCKISVGATRLEESKVIEIDTYHA